MSLKINIEDDKDLREAIKSMIHGQVKSVTREEIRPMIKDELDKKIPLILKDSDYLARIIKNLITKELIDEALANVISDITIDRLDTLVYRKSLDILRDGLRNRIINIVERDIRINMPKIVLQVNVEKE